VAATGIIDAPRLAGRVTLAPFSPRTLMETLGRPLTSIADPAALARVDLTAQYELSTTALRLYDLKLTLDESNITGELTLNDFAKPALRFDLAADRLVFDRYFSRGDLDASGGAAASGHGLSLTSDGLGALDVEGSLRVAELVFAGVRANDVTLSVHGADAPAASAAATVPGNPGDAIRAKD
jgi:AsmA protein